MTKIAIIFFLLLIPSLMVPQHLQRWLTLQLGQIPAYSGHSDLSSFNNAFANSAILQNLNHQYFSGSQDTVYEIKAYLLQEMNIHIGLSMCHSFSQFQISILVLYICLHSTQKDKYIGRIISCLAQEDQIQLMNSIQIMEQKFTNVQENHNLWNSIAQVQEENLKIKAQLEELQQKCKIIQRERLEVTNERDQLILEKKTILSKFKISNIEEYDKICEQLVKDSENSYQKFRNMTEVLDNLQEQNKQLTQRIREREEALSQMSIQFQQLVVDYNEAIRQLEDIQGEFRDSCGQEFFKMTGMGSTTDTFKITGMGSTCDSFKMTGMGQTFSSFQNGNINLQKSSNFENQDQNSPSRNRPSNRSSKKSSTIVPYRPSVYKLVRDSTQSIMKMSIDNSANNEKIKQQNQLLKLRLFSMEEEVEDAEKRYKSKLNKLRKVSNLFDPFWKKLNPQTCLKETTNIKQEKNTQET